MLTTLMGKSCWMDNGWSPRWLMRDEFVTDRAAGAVNGTGAEPGPGTRAVVDVEGKLSISGGKLVFAAQATPDWAEEGLYYGPQARVNGSALVGKLNLSTWEECGFGWHKAAAVADPDGFSAALQANTANGQLDIEGGALVVTGLSTGVEYPLAFVLGATRTKYLHRVAGGWKLDWVGVDTTDPVYPAFASLDAVGTLDSVRPVDLPAPWNSDYGIATQRLAGVRALNDTFSHSANCSIEFTVTNKGTAGNQDIYIRRQDADNLWMIRTNSGTSGLYLIERAATVDTIRAAAVGIINSGDRVFVVCNGTTISVYSAGALRFTYGLAVTAQTATQGVVATLSTNGSVSDIVAWPGTITGQAASYLDRAVV